MLQFRSDNAVKTFILPKYSSYIPVSNDKNICLHHRKYPFLVDCNNCKKKLNKFIISFFINYVLLLHLNCRPVVKHWDLRNVKRSLNYHKKKTD